MSRAEAAVQSLNSTITGFSSQVSVKVNSVAASSNQVQITADKIYAKVNDFKKGMILSEEKQLAHENLIRIDQLLKEQFGDHEAVRRTVMGVVRDFDINLVRSSTIQELSEELWITSSRYWLSYALLAITAWINNNQEIAKNALAECVRREPPKATLFFCIFNLRFGRNESAKKWFREYLKTMDPSNLGRDSAIMLQAYLAGLFGSDGELEHEVNTIVRGWIDEINRSPEQSEKFIGLYERFIINMPYQKPPLLDNIRSHCSEYNRIQEAWKDASKIQALISLVDSINVEAEQQNDENFKSRIDKVLNDLISSYDKEEEELIKEKAYFSAIMNHGGDVQAAKADYDHQQSLADNGFNVGERMVQWAVYSTSGDVDVTVRKFAMQNTKEWFKDAISKWESEVTKRYPLDYPLSVGEWKGVSNGEDFNKIVSELNDYYYDNKLKFAYLNTPNIAAIIVLILSIGLFFLTKFSLIFTLASAVFLLLRILKANKDYPAMVSGFVNELKATMNEIMNFRAFYQTEMDKKDSLINMIDAL